MEQNQHYLNIMLAKLARALLWDQLSEFVFETVEGIEFSYFEGMAFLILRPRWEVLSEPSNTVFLEGILQSDFV